ncbi:hypothetical protein HAX54_006925 [Datura stramonium]|uniref:Uncharacterized protein n=1 Tax=Datura stramonium TaxID=4076 RepID=A0ABS8TAX1_DATST|nr:hypothetical protein [Datura stramonium]
MQCLKDAKPKVYNYPMEIPLEKWMVHRDDGSSPFVSSDLVLLIAEVSWCLPQPRGPPPSRSLTIPNISSPSSSTCNSSSSIKGIGSAGCILRGPGSAIIRECPAWVAKEILEFGRRKTVRLRDGPVAWRRLVMLSSVPRSLDFPNMPHSSEGPRQPRGTELNLHVSLHASEEGIQAQFQFQCISALAPCQGAISPR